MYCVVAAFEWIATATLLSMVRCVRRKRRRVVVHDASSSELAQGSIPYPVRLSIYLPSRETRDGMGSGWGCGAPSYCRLTETDRAVDIGVTWLRKRIGLVIVLIE